MADGKPSGGAVSQWIKAQSYRRTHKKAAGPDGEADQAVEAGPGSWITALGFADMVMTELGEESTQGQAQAQASSGPLQQSDAATLPAVAVAGHADASPATAVMDKIHGHSNSERNGSAHQAAHQASANHSSGAPVAHVDEASVLRTVVDAMKDTASSAGQAQPSSSSTSTQTNTTAQPAVQISSLLSPTLAAILTTSSNPTPLSPAAPVTLPGSTKATPAVPSAGTGQTAESQQPAASGKEGSGDAGNVPLDAPSRLRAAMLAASKYKSGKPSSMTSTPNKADAMSVSVADGVPPPGSKIEIETAKFDMYAGRKQRASEEAEFLVCP